MHSSYTCKASQMLVCFMQTHSNEMKNNVHHDCKCCIKNYSTLSAVLVSPPRLITCFRCYYYACNSVLSNTTQQGRSSWQPRAKLTGYSGLVNSRMPIVIIHTSGTVCSRYSGPLKYGHPFGMLARCLQNSP